MPFLNCECSSRTILLDPDRPARPPCARCGQPMKSVSNGDWLRIQEQRRRELAAVRQRCEVAVQAAREMVRANREMRERIATQRRDAAPLDRQN
jgi:hypothetical protein